MSDNKKVLSLMVDRFRDKHGHPPRKIIVAPLALISLGVKGSVAPTWEGIPVECRLFKDEEVASRHKNAQAVNLGVFAKETRGERRLASCDLL